MIAETVVRPDAHTLETMMQRVNSRLSPEGAEAWYRNDVPALVDEVVRLRQERDVALDAFQRDMPEPLDRDLALGQVAERWRGEASGFWQKAQTKKLREEANGLRYQLADAKADHLQAVSDLAALKEQHAAQTQMLIAEREHVSRISLAAADQQEALKTRIGELEALGEQLRLEVAAAREEADRRERSAAAGHQERMARARALLEEAAGLL